MMVPFSVSWVNYACLVVICSLWIVGGCVYIEAGIRFIEILDDTP